MHRTAEESEAEHVAKMGAELGAFYSALWQDLAWLHAKWAEYAALFGTSDVRVQLLNDAAPRFFRTIQDSLWEDILLSLARITDSPKSVGKDNLSVRALPKICGAALQPRVASLVGSSVAATEFARDWRNRKLAHRDLALALSRQVQPLAPAARLQVRSALKTLDDIVNCLSSEHLDSTTMFELDDPDAESLLYVLRDGLRDDAERRERLRSGKPLPRDRKPDPL